MKISVKLDNGFLPDRFGKRSEPSDYIHSKPIRSFPIEVDELPSKTKSLALTFVDPDSIPVAGFQWIHWIAADIPANTKIIPENTSQNPTLQITQGKNTTAGPYFNEQNPKLNSVYNGPNPPSGVHNYELTIYALDKELSLPNGFWMNELQHAMSGHILDCKKIILPYKG